MHSNKTWCLQTASTQYMSTAQKVMAEISKLLPVHLNVAVNFLAGFIILMDELI